MSTKIIRMSELTGSHKIEQLELVKKSLYRKPHTIFDPFGLRYSNEHLKRIGGSLILLPLEYMADYVDEIVKNHIDANNESFIQQQIIDPPIPQSNSFNNINASSIGGIAYTALHCKIEVAREKAIQILQIVKEQYLKTTS